MPVSRAQGRDFYTTPTHTVTPGYCYYEDTEGYVGDYSESEGLSDATQLLPADAEEIYQRDMRDVYRELHYEPKYYYKARPVRRNVARNPCRKPMRMVMEEHPRIPLEHLHQYQQPYPYRIHTNDKVVNPVYNDDYEQIYQNITPVEVSQSKAKLKRNVIKHPEMALHVKAPPQYPVTVRTPRYYRRPYLNEIIKRPSTLCIPLTSRPDPSTLKKRPSTTPHSRQNTSMGQHKSQILKTTSSKLKYPSKRLANVSSESFNKGSRTLITKIDVTAGNLDSVLNQYEQISDMEHNKTDIESTRSKTKTYMHSNRKPRPVHGNRKDRTTYDSDNVKVEENKKNPISQPHNENNENIKFNEEEGTSEMLDGMLADLLKNGCNNKIKERASTCNGINKNHKSISMNSLQQNNDRYKKLNMKLQTSKETLNNIATSINYKEMSRNCSRKVSDNEYGSNESRVHPRIIHPSNDKLLPVGKVVAVPSVNASNEATAFLDEKSVMELHKSKSYIVNLIDRALSRELGTLPDDKKCNRNTAGSYQDLTPQAAVDMVKMVTSNTSKFDKDVGLEITDAITESLMTNANLTQNEQENMNSDRCSNVPAEEPAYVKQLKQLRWGHLRHIQREVRRLEDLERFLDSCCSGSSFSQPQT